MSAFSQDAPEDRRFRPQVPDPIGFELLRFERQPSEISGFGSFGRLPSFVTSADSKNDAQSPYVPGRIVGPVKLAKRIVELWALDEQEVRGALGFEPSEQKDVDDMFSGVTTLKGPDRKDRIAILFRIHNLLWALYQDAGAERAWLRAPNASLGGRAPAELLKHGSMENLLTVRELVEHMAGR